jgi:hypothetical protein
MSSKDYGVEVIRAYEFKRVGQVIFPPALMRDRLVNAGFVRRLAPEAVAEVAEAPAKSDLNQQKPTLKLKSRDR